MNLITGATGIVGAHVALQLLQQNKVVFAIKREGSDVSKTKKLFSYYTPDAEKLFQKINWINADVTDIFSVIDALEGIETVYHCAGFVSFNPKKYKLLHKINTEGTANIVNACLEKKSIKLCHVSSIATLQNPDITQNIDEKVYWKNSPSASEYAISKYNAEREVWRGIEEGLQAVIVNPSAILSPGFWNQSSGKIFTTCYQGNPFYTSGGNATVDARDVATCMVKLINENIFGERFVIVEGNYTLKILLGEIHRNFQKKAPSIKAGKILLTIAGCFDKIKCFFTNTEPVITKEIISTVIEKNTYSNQKIKSKLNHQFIPLNETLKFVCQSYLSDLK
jgi:dihydroflavonol-4-reductase